jgi:hypothetical protein
MSFHDRGFNSRDGFDSSSSGSRFFLMTEATMAAVRGGVLPGPILERADIGSSHPGLPSVMHMMCGRCPGVLRN